MNIKKNSRVWLSFIRKYKSIYIFNMYYNVCGKHTQCCKLQIKIKKYYGNYM